MRAGVKSGYDFGPRLINLCECCGLGAKINLVDDASHGEVRRRICSERSFCGMRCVLRVSVWNDRKQRKVDEFPVPQCSFHRVGRPSLQGYTESLAFERRHAFSCGAASEVSSNFVLVPRKISEFDQPVICDDPGKLTAVCAIRRN